MKKGIFTTLLIAGFALNFSFGQNQYSFLLHKTYAQRCRLIDSVFYTSSLFKDSAALFQELNKVAVLAKDEKDEELYLEMEFIKCHSVPLAEMNEHFESRLLSLIREADEKDFLAMRIRARDYLGDYYYLKYGNFGAAIEQYLNAYYLLKPVSVAAFPNKRNYVYNDLASIYYNLGDFDNAKKFLLEADTLPPYVIAISHKMRDVINVSNTLGLIYRKTARYDSAEYYFKKAYAVATTDRDSVWVGIAGGNIGITYFLQKRYKEAIPLLEDDVRLSVMGKEYGNAANSLLKLAEINLSYNDTAITRRQLVQTRSLIDSSLDPYVHFENFYPLMAKLSDAEGNSGMAYRYADSALIIKDSMFKQKSAVALARAQQKTDVEHHLAEVRQLQANEKIKTLQRNTLIYLAGLLVAITLLLIYRQRLLKKEKLLAQAKEEQAVKELEMSKQQLDNFTLNIREKNELIEKLTGEMESLQVVFGKDAADHRSQTIDQLRKATILTEEQWEAFRNTFEKAYPAYFVRLQQKLPGLSAADLRFLALSKLKFNPKEMGAILGISPGSIRMSRHRLRKKYNLEDEEGLEVLVENL